MIESYLEILDEGYYEVKFAFDGLEDRHVWTRPSPALPSIGQIAGHIAYWEAVKLAGENGDPLPDPVRCRIKSLLVDRRFSYYPMEAPSEEHLAMTSAQVCGELLRVHAEATAYVNQLAPAPDTCPPGFGPHWTYRGILRYAAIHIAYHTGQIYTTRHLLGESTPDN